MATPPIKPPPKPLSPPPKPPSGAPAAAPAAPRPLPKPPPAARPATSVAAPPEAYEPEPAPADAQVPAAPGSGLGHAIGVWFKRGTRSDLEVVEVLPDEQVVSDLYADSESFRRILLWRRAALFVAMIFQIPPLLLELGNGISDLASKDTPGGLAAVSFILVILNAILLVTVFVAFKRWESWRSSRRLLIMTWLVAYGAPFVVAIIPFTSLVGADNMNREAREIAGLLGGLSYFVILAPKVLALVPGVMRAALIAKVAFPMSPMPGWLVLLSAPFDALLMHVVLMMPYQMAGGGFMAPALFLVVAAPLVIFVAGRKLVRPSSFEEAVAVIKRSRGTALILNVIGGIFLLIGLVDTLGIKLPNGHVLFGPADAIMPVFSMIAGIFVLEVIGLDVMLGAWIKMHGDEQNPEFTAGLAAHRQHMDAFVAVVHRDEPPPPSEPPATSALADDPFATTQPGGPPKA